MPTHARGRPRISKAFCCFAVLLALLAVLPGCGCGDDARDAAAADAGPDPCAPPPVNAVGAVSFADAVRFLYDGVCPRQTGVDKTVFDDFTGYDCDKIRAAAGLGALAGAVGGAAKAGGRQCFAAGTEVATENGAKAIEDIAVGDRVLSRSEGGEVSNHPVTRVFQRSDAEEARAQVRASLPRERTISTLRTPPPTVASTSVRIAVWMSCPG